MAVLIDTSVLGGTERGQLPLDEVIHADDQYAISVVSIGELLHGVHRARGRRAQTREAFVESLLGRLWPVPIDLAVARAYARASADMSARGITVNANDLWIGATAIANGFEVLAIDGDFNLIPGLSVVTVGVPPTPPS